jgi:TrmH family RNA methyltransferase
VSGQPPPSGQVLGARNARIAGLRRLVARRAERDRSGLFVVDGPVLVGEALRCGATVSDVFVDVDAGDDFAEVVAEATRCAVAVHQVGSGVLARVADPVNPRPIVAVVQRQPPRDDWWAHTSPARAMVLVDVADPGNVGTLIRSAEAAGFACVVVAGDGADPFGPKAVRASAGSILRIATIVERDADSCVAGLAEHGYTLVGTATGAPSYTGFRFPARTALVLGSEAHGLRSSVAGRIEQWVGIAMAGSVESLNVAVAGSVLAFAVAHGAPGDQAPS